MDKRPNFYSNTMEPTLQYLIPTRDVAFAPPVGAGELILIRPFDTIYILKGTTFTVYNFYAVCRIFLHSTGLVSSEVKIKLLNPKGEEFRVATVSNPAISGELGLNVPAYFAQVKFEEEGTYSLSVEVNINGGEFKKVGSLAYFLVKKLT